MSFGKISKTLSIPQEATATYTFYRLSLCDAGPPRLTISHAGDGTPSFRRAMFHAANAARASGLAGDGTISEHRVKQLQFEHAKRVADHCARSWENVFEDGSTTPAACSSDKVHEFLCAIIDSDGGRGMYMEFRDWAENADNFRSETVVSGDLGKR